MGKLSTYNTPNYILGFILEKYYLDNYIWLAAKGAHS